MFYAYVRQLPMVEGNLDLIRGDRLEYSCGSIRRSKADLYGFRAFVLTDKDRGVTYRVMRKGMVVEWPGGSSFVRNPEELKRTPFAVEGDAGEINSFLSLCDRLVHEDKRRKSITNRLRLFAMEPVGKILIAGAIVYAIITAIVLVLG